jgi:hypothetical protein
MTARLAFAASIFAPGLKSTIIDNILFK